MIVGHMKLSEDAQNQFVHISTDLQLHSDIKDNEYLRILKKIVSISLTNHVKGSIITWQGNIDDYDMHDLLQSLRDRGYKYATIWFEGSAPMHDYEEEFAKWAKDNNDWTVMGHILNREGRVPIFHEQMIAFNLEKLEKLEFTDVSAPRAYPAYEQSEEHVHDDYTPMWLQGLQGQNTQLDFNVEEELVTVFDYMMYSLLERGCKIVNVPHEIRDAKFCIYPEDDVEQTLNWLTNPEFLKKPYPERYQHKFDEIPGDKWILYEFLNMSNEVLYVTNTEGYPDEHLYNKTKDTNVIICPASGLNQFLFSMPHLETLEKVIWTDFNALSIRWVKHILATWDGYNFKQFFEDNKPLLLDWGLKHLELLVYTEQQLDELTEMFNEPEMNARYNQLKDLEHVFLTIDIVKQYDQILPHVQDKNVILQLSNIYSYEINYIVNKHFKTHVAFYSLVDALVSTNKNVYLRGDTPQGVYHEMTNVSRIGNL